MLTLIALALPASAMGQATRTWVSGVGDDANPCSRTAPCKTLAGAISKTAAKGEINAIDSGGFGGVTITKSITINLGSVHGGVLVSGTNAIVVNAAATDRVVLKGLKINGLGTGLHGIRVLQARSVNIDNVDVFGFVRNGIDIENSNALARVVVKNSSIHDNLGNGILVAPTGSGVARVSARRNDIDDNTCGVTAARSADPSFNFSSSCGTLSTGTSQASVNVLNNAITLNERQGVFANGSNTLVRIGNNEISGSISALAIQAVNSGSILSYGNNQVSGNPGGNGTATGSADAPL
ncbi:MAG TPA: right-handed parallel beta-helix repeat-containing protein [Solirubrobacteraceae bacterium]|jgi:hypothetical protein|nr:right-handed parallel beta-helix repeat-containing protein [Solirubrobacteraceae bacterium]